MWLSHGANGPEHVGPVYRFDGRVTKEEWDALKINAAARGRLFHALKF